MPAPEKALIVKLCEVILDVYSYEEGEKDFGMLLYTLDSDFDYANDTSGLFKHRVFTTLKWHFGAASWNGLEKVAAHVAQAKPAQQQLQNILNEIRSELNAHGPPPPLPAGSVAAEIETLIELNETENKKGAGLSQFVQELRPALRRNHPSQEAVVNTFHLSESPHRRLASVLALECAPTAGYLQWLGERVIVENAVTAYQATQSLTIAALRLNSSEVDRVKRTLTMAARKLDSMSEHPDEVSTVPHTPTISLSLLKKHLLSASTLLRMRSENRHSDHLLLPDEVPVFADMLISGYSADELDGLLKKDLAMSLKRIAVPQDPIEIAVARLLVTAYENAWETELLRAVFAHRSTVPTQPNPLQDRALALT